jgi:hypothetical protein
MPTNMKPADELLTIRKRIKELQAREKEISDGIKSGDLEDAGDFAIARLSTRKTTRFDKKAAEAELGDLSRFNVTGETVALLVEELAQEVEA